jgi:hypothetical protein
LAVEAEPAGVREIRDLASRFNVMTDALRQEAATVQRRTAELEEAKEQAETAKELAEDASKANPGGDVFRWSRWAWAGLFGVVAFPAVHVLFGGGKSVVGPPVRVPQ